MRRTLIVVFGFSFVVAIGASAASCSSSDATPGSPGIATDASASDATIKDAGLDVIIDPMNCVAPGTPGNSQGIGGYCSPGGRQCDTAGPDGAARICTAEVGDIVPPHAWFCTIPCSGPSDTTTCGPGAACVVSTIGTGCVPTSCSFLEEGGLVAVDAGDDDAGADSSSDAAGD